MTGPYCLLLPVLWSKTKSHINLARIILPFWRFIAFVLSLKKGDWILLNLIWVIYKINAYQNSKSYLILFYSYKYLYSSPSEVAGNLIETENHSSLILCLRIKAFFFFSQSISHSICSNQVQWKRMPIKNIKHLSAQEMCAIFTFFANIKHTIAHQL